MGLDPDGCGDMQGDDGSKKIGERSMNIRIKSYWVLILMAAEICKEMMVAKRLVSGV